MSTQITFAKEPCTRCSGTGRHSYCQMHRDTCFKCGGTGKQLTRAGKAARNAYDAMLVERFTVDARDVVPGQQVRYDGKWRAVTAVELDGGPNCTGWALDSASGEWVPFLSIQSARLSIGLAPDARVQVRPTVAEFNAVCVPFARKLKGAIVTDVTDTAAATA